MALLDMTDCSRQYPIWSCSHRGSQFKRWNLGHREGKLKWSCARALWVDAVCCCGSTAEYFVIIDVLCTCIVNVDEVQRESPDGKEPHFDKCQGNTYLLLSPPP